MSDNLTQSNHVNISGLSRITVQKPNKMGNTILAYFNAETRGFDLKGSAFVRTNNNELTVFMLKLDNDPTDRQGVKLCDCQLRSCFICAAQYAYWAMGGTDGEWIQGDEPAIVDDTPSRLLTKAD